MSFSESKMIAHVLWLAQEVTVRLHCQLLKKTINHAMVLLRSRSVCKPTVAAKPQTEPRFGSGLIYSVQIQTWFSATTINSRTTPDVEWDGYASNLGTPL